MRRTLFGVVAALVAVPWYLQPPDTVESWLMFDGVCNLCNGFINFVADGDSQRKVKFGAQQKHMELLERVGAPTDLSTLILIQGDRHYLYSTAALRTLAVMNYPWRGLAAFALVPAPLRLSPQAASGRLFYYDDSEADHPLDSCCRSSMLR